MPNNNYQLTQEQFTQLIELTNRCKQNDGNTVPIYSDLLLKRRNLPSNLLYYQQQQLIGFLSVFFFYDNACEVILMVDPRWRRQHIAKELISTIMPVIHSRGLSEIFFASPKGLNDAWFSQRGLFYRNTEIQMQWNTIGKNNPPSSKVSFYQPSSDEEIPILVNIDMACFNTEKTEMENRFHHLLRDDTYQLFIICYNNQPIGKAHLHQEEGQFQLSDIAILPDVQGKGFGQALVEHCIQYAKRVNALPLRLCVESTNQTALNLYQKLGFETVNTWDFWTFSMELECKQTPAIDSTLAIFP